MNKPNNQTTNGAKPPRRHKAENPQTTAKPQAPEKTRFTAREWARIEATRAVLEILPDESLAA